MPDEPKTPTTPVTPAPTGGDTPGNEPTKVKVPIEPKKPEPKAPDKPEPKPTEPVKPYATFDTADAFMDRMKREGKKQAEEMAKAAGFESVEAMQKAAEEGKKAIEAAKTEEQKREEERQKLIKEKTEAETRGQAAVQAANEKLIAADLKLLAAEMGASVSVKVLKGSLDLSAVKVDDEGTITGLKEALEALKTTEPALFTGREAPKPVSTATAPPPTEPGKVDAKTMTPEQFKDFMWKNYRVKV